MERKHYKKLDECACSCNKKVTKIYFCPECKSEQVGYVFRFGNAFGVIPKMECRKCKHSAPIFPQWVVEQSQLKKLNKKAKWI